MSPQLAFIVIGLVVGFVIGTVALLVRSFFWHKQDRRRWAPALFVGLLTYVVVDVCLLLIFEKVIGLHHTQVFLSTLGAIVELLAVYAACLVSAVIAPRENWRTASHASISVLVIWTCFYLNAPNFIGQLVGALVGGLAAFATAYFLFHESSHKLSIPR